MQEVAGGAICESLLFYVIDSEKREGSASQLLPEQSPQVAQPNHLLVLFQI